MTVISKAMESLEDVRVAVLVQANDGLDSMKKIDYDSLNEQDKTALWDIQENLRRILLIMSR